MALERLHKVLAAAGVASRRRCEELIAEGRVTIDGLAIRAMGTLVDPEKQEIRFDGERIRREPPAHWLCYKPVGYVCTNAPQDERPTVVSLVRDRRKLRLFTVGRLDEESEGLIIVTNDGDFANRLAHPRHGVEKTYSVKLAGSITQDALYAARRGVHLAEGKTRPMHVTVQKRSKQFSHVVVKLGEGKNRQLRRVFAKVGFPVAKLKRVRIGPIGVKGVARGTCRRLEPAEISALLAACDAAEAAPAPGPAARAAAPGKGKAAGKAAGRTAAGGRGSAKTGGGKKASARKKAPAERSAPKGAPARSPAVRKAPAKKRGPGPRRRG